MPTPYDAARVEAAVRELLAAVGDDPDREGLVDTPARVARMRPSVQERVTSQVADALMERLEPRGAIVVVEAEHLCMSMRGVQKPGARTVTSAVRGVLKSSAVTRAEAMSLILGR